MSNVLFAYLLILPEVAYLLETRHFDTITKMVDAGRNTCASPLGPKEESCRRYGQVVRSCNRQQLRSPSLARSEQLLNSSTKFARILTW